MACGNNVGRREESGSGRSTMQCLKGRRLVLKGLQRWNTRAVTYNTETDLNPAGAAGTRVHTIDVSGFAFNSSILWDPERWGRPTSLPDTSQVSPPLPSEC